MFEIIAVTNGFKISIGNGKRGGYPATNVDQIKVAVEHYFRSPWHKEVIENCPLCRN